MLLAAAMIGGLLDLYVPDARAEAEAVSSNLISNPDFETYTGSNGVADGWSSWKSEGASATYQVVGWTASSGQLAQQISGTFPTVDGGVNVYQDVTVSGAGKYVVNGRAFITSIANARAQVVAYYYDDSNQLLGSELAFDYNAGIGWTSFGQVLSAPVRTKWIRLFLNLKATAAQGSGTVYFDSISLSQGENLNLFRNGDFELNTLASGADGWSSWTSAGTISSNLVTTANVASGARAQQVNGAFTKYDGGTNVSQDIKVSGGTEYSLNGRITIPNISKAKAQVVIYYYDASINLLRSEIVVDCTSALGWTSFGEVITPPANTQWIRVFLSLVNKDTTGLGGGTLIADSLSLTPKGSLDLDLMNNGGFEMRTGTSSVAESWTSWVGANTTANFQVSATNKYAGQNAQRINGSFRASDGSMNVYQDVLVKANTSYTLAGKVLIPSISNAKAQIVIFYYDASTNLLSSELAFDYSSYLQWTSIGKVITTPANTKWMRVFLNLAAQSTSGSGDIYFDSISLKLSTSGQGPNANPTKRYIYDQQGRLNFLMLASGEIQRLDYDRNGNMLSRNKLVPSSPLITTNAASVQLAAKSYTVYVFGVSNTAYKVEFPTWTLANGQDELSIPWYYGEKVTDGVWRFTINYDKHKNEKGTYRTQVYVDGTYIGQLDVQVT